MINNLQRSGVVGQQRSSLNNPSNERTEEPKKGLSLLGRNLKIAAQNFSLWNLISNKRHDAYNAAQRELFRDIGCELAAA